MSAAAKISLGVVGALSIALSLIAWAPIEALADPLRDVDRAARAAREGDFFFVMLEEGRNLDRPFPAMIGAQADSTPELVELGALLFFDPLLSGDNKTSCAHCHHPDHGFADGRETGMGFGGTGVASSRSGGVVLGRNTPTIWNAAYSHRQFWDGRAADLEEQAEGPITHPDEMGQDPEELLGELLEVPEYTSRFEAAFGSVGVDMERVLAAIGAFERTLTTTNSAYDRYARGDREALSDAERRGLASFRSLRSRCFECHNLPTFANPEFKVIGVPPRDGEEPDRGRGEVAGVAYDHAFKVPTLRNVALTAPYMHNGIFETLEEVIDFYSEGGGRGADFDLPQLDDKIRRFRLSWEERADLVAFLNALTDESALPEIPEEVPSGLPVVVHSGRDTPSAPKSRAPSVSKRAAITHTVDPSGTIQAAIDAARPGDTIEVLPGVYSEALILDCDDLTLRGLKQGDQRALLDGRGELTDAIIGSGRGITIEGFAIANYTANGVMLNLSEEITLRDLNANNTGLYGLYPVESIGVRVENCSVTGASDAGIYVGQCKDVVVRGCDVRRNVTGIEIENCVNALVEENVATDNAAGLLVFLLPNNPSKVSVGCLLRANQVFDNNHENFAAEGAMVGNVPSGTGVLILGADDVEVTGNEIYSNKTCGVATLSLNNLVSRKKAGGLDVDPWPDRVWVHGNTIRGNGFDPAPRAREQGIPGADLLWDLTGVGNSWEEPGVSSEPPLLPRADWSTERRRFFRRLWRAAGA